MSKKSIIVALSENYAIGINNTLPWHLPADLKRFKSLTTGNSIIMGRNTFESLPNGPLPNRKNIVLSKNHLYQSNDGYICYSSLDEAFKNTEEEKEVFIIGGANVYTQAISLVDSLYITWIHQSINADTFFPQIDFSVWEEVWREDHLPDEKNQFNYSFVNYQRRK